MASRILIIKLSAVGDVIHAVPIACALRDQLPGAYLAWAVGPSAGTLLQGHSALDEVIPVPRNWLKSPRGICRFRRQLQARRFDAVIDAQCLTKSAILAWLSGARRRIGFGNRWGRELSRFLHTELVETPGPHMIDHNVGLLSALGISKPRIHFDMPLYEPEQASMDDVIRQNHCEGGFAVINVGAGWESKLWPAERFAAVARYLGSRRGMPALVVWAGDAERRAAETVVAGSGGYALLAPSTTLRELASLTRRAQIFLGSDTGPLHLAVALGTPCVGLYGPWPADRHGPYGPGHIAIQKRVFEGPTRRRRTLSSEYMEAIDVESVCEACDAILDREGWIAAA
jgi:lipopolysaccharide heptosyltransferase I